MFFNRFETRKKLKSSHFVPYKGLYHILTVLRGVVWGDFKRCYFRLGRHFRIRYFDFPNSDIIFKISNLENLHVPRFLQISAISDLVTILKP